MTLPGQPRGSVARSVIAHSVLAALMIVTEMFVFVPAVLFHCAIRNGRRAAWVTLALAALAGAFFASLSLAADLEAGRYDFSVLAGIVLGMGIPALIAVPMIERGQSLGRVLAILLLCSFAGLAATELLAQATIDYSPMAAHAKQLREVNAAWIQVYRDKGVPAEGIQFAERVFGYTVRLLPALVLSLFAVFFTLSLLLFGRLKVWRDLAARRADAQALGAYLFRNFAMPDWVLFAFVIGGLAPLLTGMLQTIAANVLAVVAFLYMLQGVALLRFMVGAMVSGPAGLMLGAMLIMVFTFSGVGPLVLGVAGLFDPFFDFRHFKKRKDDSNESHSD